MRTETEKAGIPAERLFAWSALLFVGVALAVLLGEPDALLPAGDGGAARSLVHLLTLGGVLSGYYVLQNALWERLYGRGPAWPRLTLLVWALHVSGVALLAGGFFVHSTLVAHVGGHYLVPTGMVLALAQGVGAAFRRPPGAPRQLAAHLPGLGLLVTIMLGAMMVLDAYGGEYGIYTAHTILVHALSGAFLFFLPFVLCGHGPQAPDSGEAEGRTDLPFSSTALLLPPVGLASLGVLTVALSGVPEGYGVSLPAGLGLPAGLALLGGVALWVGLPALGFGRPLTLPALRRSLWSALGVLLLYAAIRSWRGGGMEEGVMLMRFAVTLFLFAVAVPEILAGLGLRFSPVGDASAERFEALQFVVLLFAAGLLMVAQLAEMALLVRLAALPGLGMVLWQCRRMLALPRT